MYEANCIVTQGLTLDEKVKMSAHVRPSEQQLKWQELEYIAFIHFGMNVYTGNQWGNGCEDPSIFNPSEFDPEQWISVCKEAGMKMVILTVKHHDGFCLWPTKTTSHNISASPFRDGKGDMVKGIADACHKYNMKLGLYLSPWDRHDKRWDTPEYDAVFSEQLRELCTWYGEISEFWFDGACGDKEIFTRVNYDFDSYYDLIEELQPGCVFRVYDPHLVAPGYELVKQESAFSGEYLKRQHLKWRGKEIRWCGNESGKTRISEWSVYPLNGPFVSAKTMMNNDLGSRQRLVNADALVWYPCEVNTTLNGLWFWNEGGHKVRPLDELIDIYFSSVGGNGLLLLNLAPDKRGLIPEDDVESLIQIRRYLDKTFERNYAQGAVVKIADGDIVEKTDNLTDGNKLTYVEFTRYGEPATIEISLPEARSFNIVMLQELIQEGQRVEKFSIEYFNGKRWNNIYNGTVIGYKKLARFKEITTSKIRISITEYRDCPVISNVALYMAPTRPKAPNIRRDKDGSIIIETEFLAENIYYTLDGCEPDVNSINYTGPFTIQDGVQVRALAVFPENRVWEHNRFTKSSKEFYMMKNNWKVIYADNKMESAFHAFDDDCATVWMTNDLWDMLSADGQGCDLPHEIQIDISEMKKIIGFVYTPNQASSVGHIFNYEFYVSNSKDDWGLPVIRSTFDNTANDPKPVRIRFKNAVQGRYIRLVALSTVDKSPVVAIAELDLMVQ